GDHYCCAKVHGNAFDTLGSDHRTLPWRDYTVSLRRDRVSLAQQPVSLRNPGLLGSCGVSPALIQAYMMHCRFPPPTVSKNWMPALSSKTRPAKSSRMSIMRKSPAGAIGCQTAHEREGALPPATLQC